jgi:hypothetical protein
MQELTQTESIEVGGGLVVLVWVAIGTLALEAARLVVEAGYQFGKDLGDRGCD